MKKIIFFSIIAFSLNLYASSDINLDEQGEQIQRDTVSTVNIALQSDKIINVVMPKQSEEEQSLIEKLNHARKAGDKKAAHALQSKLDAMHGIVIQAAVVSDDSVIDDGGDTMTTMEVTQKLEVTQTLSGDIQVNTLDDDLINPSMISTPEGILYVAMARRTNNDLYMYRSDNNGNTWTRVLGLSPGKNPSLAYAGGNIYMAYEKINTDDTRDVKVFRVSVADTFDWSFSTVSSNILMNGAGDHIVPRIISDDEYFTFPYLYVTYSTFAIDYYPVFHSRSTDGGATWTAPANITGGSENTSSSGNPDIIYDYVQGSIYVAFNKPGWNGTVWQPQIWVTIGSSYGGGAWSTPVQLTDYPYKSIKPRIESANGKTMIGWLYDWDNDGSEYGIYYHSSSDSGATWSFTGAISNVNGVIENGFELTHSTNKFHVSYTNGNLHELMYRNIPTVDIGTSTKWTSPIQADAGEGYVSGTYPWSSMVVPPNSNEKACFTWSDFREGTTNYGIYFNRVSTPVSPAIIMYLLN